MPEGSLFNRLWDAFDTPFAAPNAQGFKVDVKDNGGAYELTADLPGLKQEDISLSYENDYLTLSAKREDNVDEKDDKGNYIRRERSYGQMERSFYITGIDKEHAKAEFKDGVLKVELPKLKDKVEVSHQIPISCAG
ncbi:MAG: Hsp20/alpha crystallin family protein [Selenomonadaceae bacterium]|nr:Hsp20/alpha crystallin family protein [Selenomonadaceae bacterium]